MPWAIADHEFDGFDFGEEEGIQEAMNRAAEAQQQAASYALCMAQSLDDATEAYESLTMAVQSDPVPCLSYISRGMAALAYILENAETEELAKLTEDFNNNMTEIERWADRLREGKLCH